MDNAKLFEMIGNGDTQKDIAKQLGVSQPAISLAVSRFFKNIKLCPHCGKPIVKEN